MTTNDSDCRSWFSAADLLTTDTATPVALLGAPLGLGSITPGHCDEAPAVVRAAMKQVGHQFSSLEWLSDEWAQLDDRDFSERDIDWLLAHLKSTYGRKQVMIVDHSVAFQVRDCNIRNHSPPTAMKAASH